MSAAHSLEHAFDGQGRCRKKKGVRTKARSHYQFATWSYDEEGKRAAVPIYGNQSDKRSSFPLICTTIKNEGTGTETLVWIHFDLDYKRADKKWRSDEKLDWPKISETLRSEVPALFQYITGVTRSSGGKGLGLMLSISPLELIEETKDIQKLAFRLQAWIIDILNYYGMGADKGASGLKRLMPNIFNPDRFLDRDEVTEAIIQTKRPRVIQDLLFKLRFHTALKPIGKRERSDLLWPDIRVEESCARLYMDLLDRVGPWGSQQLSAQNLIDQYGLAKNTAYKLLANPPKWLISHPVQGEGYRITIYPSRELTDRALELLSGRGVKKGQPRLPSFVVALISAPEEVEAGERNSWLVSVVLGCKWKGIAQAEVLGALKAAVKRVPSYRSSRSLRGDMQRIIRSLYAREPSSKNKEGSSPHLVLADWLQDLLLLNKPKRLSQKIAMKGTSVAGSQPTASSSFGAESFSASTGRSTELFGPEFESQDLLFHLEGFQAGVRGALAPQDAHAGSENRLRNALDKPQPDGVSLKPLPQIVSPTFLTSPGEKDGFQDPLQNHESPPLKALGFLSRQALKLAFSKALLKSSLSAAEKGQTLETVLRLGIAERIEAMCAFLLGQGYQFSAEDGS